MSAFTGVTTHKKDGIQFVKKGNNRALATLTTTQTAPKSVSGNLPVDFEV